MAYTTINKSIDYFNTKLYTGNGGTNAITGVGHQPDLVWLKERSSAGAGLLFDAVRGATKFVRSSDAAAEVTAADTLTAFNSDGFTLGADAGNYAANQNSETYVAWNWKAGTSFTNDASSTGIGSIDSSGSFNNDAGFSIVTYTGNGSSGATVKHGMNQKPSMFIIKDRDNSNEGWMVYHTSLGATKYMRLNETGAVATGSAYFNNTEPTSSVFTIGNNDVVNKSGDKYVTYCFAEKKGYSKFGSYTGNGNADGTFVYTGFKPAFVMFKGNNTSDWQLWDNKRDTFNPVEKAIHPNANGGASTDQDIDFLSNGFKIRSNQAHLNGSGVEFIYMAFAEAPLVGTNGVTAKAR